VEGDNKRNINNNKATVVGVSNCYGWPGGPGKLILIIWGKGSSEVLGGMGPFFGGPRVWGGKLVLLLWRN